MAFNGTGLLLHADIYQTSTLKHTGRYRVSACVHNLLAATTAGQSQQAEASGENGHLIHQFGAFTPEPTSCPSSMSLSSPSSLCPSSSLISACTAALPLAVSPQHAVM